MKAIDIKEYILSTRAVTVTSKISFSSFASQFAEECRSRGTKRNYLHTINKLSLFTQKNVIHFEDITPSFLRQFDDYLLTNGSGVNTRSIHFRNIRAVFNRAIDDEAINQDLYPFRKFKIKSEEKDKVNLSAKQVKALYDYEFETKSLCWARDFWMLSFFLCGINPIDLFNLKKPGKDKRVSFIRSKMLHSTHDIIKLLIQAEAQKIIDKYKAADDSEYLLFFEYKYVNYDSFKNFLSKKIREISKILDFTGLTLYWARYSWATIADSLDIPEKTISKGLGHSDKSISGRKYIAFDWSKVDEANRKVIDMVLRDKKKNPL